MAIANYIVENTDLDEVWFVVSPDSPFKEHDSDIIPFTERCHLISFDARKSNVCLRVSDVEGYLKTPHYTINTVSALEKMYPYYTFKVILGEDNFRIIDSFYKWETLLFGRYGFIVIPRLVNNTDGSFDDFVKSLCVKAGFSCDKLDVTLLTDCPRLDISSSFIRKQMKEGKRINAYVPPNTSQYLNIHPYK